MNEYKRLGDYIREVNVRNRDLKITKPMGINIDKHFMPSVANFIGTDLSNYKLVSKRQFACNLMHVGRDEKIPMAILGSDDPIIVSPAYFVFEVSNPDILYPEYLMMWFSRKEFDRNAWFYTDADVRGGMGKDALLDMKLPIPSIERQREIVAEYETLSKRIYLNEQMISKLEETSQTLYRKMFVDGIDKENLPDGWRMGKLGELCEKTIGGDWGKDTKVENYISEVFCIRGADIPYISRGMKSSMPTRFILEKNLHDREIKSGDIVIEISGGSPTQSTGRSVFITDDILNYANKSLICSNFCRLITVQEYYKIYVFSSIRHLYVNDVLFRLENSSNGVKNLDLSALLNDEEIIIPSNEIAKFFSNLYLSLLKNIYLFGQETEKLTELQSLLLAKMGQ